MNNYRPLLIFGATLVVIIAGFWGVLTFASNYNQRLAQRAQPSGEMAQKPEKPAEQKPSQPQPQNPPKDDRKPANEEQPKAQNPTPSQPTPEPKPTPTPTPKATPSPAPVPTTGPAAAPTQVPKAGADELNVVLTAVGIGLTIVLAARLRRQTIALRPNR